jgi:hypothetical protein
MDFGRDREFRVEVRLMSEPCLWRWEIRDPCGEIIDSSWTREWMAYDSAEDALRAGRRRLLTSLTRR